MTIDKKHFRGTFLGGAAADAQAYNSKSDGIDLISDNTQMASFTVDGLIWALDKAKNKGVYAYTPCLFYAYQKWYYTQTGSLADKSYNFILKGEILNWEEFYARRGEGTTSLKALEGSLHNMYGTLKNRINNSKGCGGVMRVAPVGMCFCYDEKAAFKIGCESAALTHGHIGGIAPAGYVSAVVSLILQGNEIRDAVEKALRIMESLPGHQDSSSHIKKAVQLAERDMGAAAATRLLGEGFTGEELVALAVYCILKYNGDFRDTIEYTAKHDGNNLSLSTVCGNILGAYHGVAEIPYEWIKNLELLELFIYGSDKLLDGVTAKTAIPRKVAGAIHPDNDADISVDGIITGTGMPVDSASADSMTDKAIV